MTRLRWPRRAPWDEAFFLEWIDDAGVGWWFRWTLTDGVRPRVALWAMRDDGLTRRGHCRELPMRSLRAAPGGWFAGDGFWVGADRLVGDTGPISWDLAISSPDPTWRSVPFAAEALGLGRTYEPAMPAVRVEGVVTVDGVPLPVRGHGTVGHLFGSKNRVAAWAWVHASHFGEDIVFEALSAQLGSRTAWPLTSVHVRIGDQHWTLSGALDLLRIRAELGTDTLTLRAVRGSTTIEATMTLPPAHIVARYEDPTGAVSACRNSTRCTLAVRVVDRRRGVDRAFRTDRAIGELGTRGEPTEPPTV